jgi:hypothetical protein
MIRHVDTQSQQQFLACLLAFTENQPTDFLVRLDDVVVTEIDKYFVTFGLQQQLSAETFQFLRQFDMKLMTLSETLKQDIGQLLLRNQRIQSQSIE